MRMARVEGGRAGRLGGTVRVRDRGVMRGGNKERMEMERERRRGTCMVGGDVMFCGSGLGEVWRVGNVL